MVSGWGSHEFHFSIIDLSRDKNHKKLERTSSNLYCIINTYPGKDPNKNKFMEKL
jgi:hypothetical protein